MTTHNQSLADEKIHAEIAKLMAETTQIQQNMKYRIWVMGAAYLGAMATILNIFGK